MAASSYKYYNDEDFNAKKFVESHFSDGKVSITEESVGFPIKILHGLFSSGQVKGNTLLDISSGALVYQLLSASNVFKEIYVMDFTDANIRHFRQWLEKGKEATDWSYASKQVCQLQGNSAGWQEQEEKVRRAVKSVVKWDIFGSGCADPLLVPRADCVLSLWIINIISKTREEYQRNLASATSWLKVGGYLLLFTGLNMTFYTLGQHKYFILPLDEAFVRESVTKAGCVIEKVELLRNKVSTDKVDYDHLLFILARKEREA
ncbi:nicotinamide N-methyltransferase-like [Pseudophryne corroboree]|uniref:nicotinamide N-methyltransferase-like n=1 Tax=Pseudophryne corroboree TaxID=495146 RepID=UPI003081A7B5